jgi:hypothetical protein
MKTDSQHIFNTTKTAIWQQFAAALDMVAVAINACPDGLWADETQHMIFWRVAHHALIMGDMYVDGAIEGYTPPAPFEAAELSFSHTPSRVYTKAELMGLLEHCRARMIEVVENMTEEQALRKCVFPWVSVPYLELCIYNQRHVQEHAGQLLLMVGQNDVKAPSWVAKGRKRKAAK